MANILIIDDEKGIRNLLREILETEGHHVVEASDGRKGLELYRAAPTDLVITDILMPVKDGMETTWQLTREFPGAKIIAITGGRGDTNFLDVVKLFGAHRTIEKPFQMQQVLEAVREELQRK
jgi:two-component system response regulator (stage 0 sporulation protein F)